MDVFQFISGILDVSVELDVLFLELLVLISLLWVELVKFGFVVVADLLHLVLRVLDFAFHVPLFRKESVQLVFLFVVLHLDVHVQRLDIVGLRVAAVFVQRQVVVGQLALVLPHVLDQGLVLALQSQEGGVVLVDVLHLHFHLVDLAVELVVFVLEEIEVVRPVVNLSAWTLVDHLDT